MTRPHHTRRSTYLQAERRFVSIDRLRRAGMTQEQIALRLHIPRPTVAKYLSPRCKAKWRLILKPKPCHPNTPSTLTTAVIRHPTPAEFVRLAEAPPITLDTILRSLHELREARKSTPAPTHFYLRRIRP